MRKLRARAASAMAGCLCLATGAMSGPLQTAVDDTKLLLDARFRTESVEQEGLVDEAHASTLRLRAGFETGKAWNTSLLVEGDAIIPIDTQYRPDPAVPSMTTYPVVPDPEGYELNRLQLTNTSLPGTTLTLGRQRISLDDQRFVGASGWRQNEQTFDAFRVVNRSVKNLTLDGSYVHDVRRVFGHDSPQGSYGGDTYLLNAGYQTPVGKITGFGYLLDFEPIATVPAAVRDSSTTYGLRFAGEKPLGAVKFSYSASYATQTDRGDNPLSFDLDYQAADLSAGWKQLSVGAGIESLEGNGVKGFTTPLATLHKFQGWADKFLTTPANGIEDRYLTLGGNFKKLGGMDSLALVLGYHDYDAQRIAADYGHEWNLSAAAKWQRVNLLLKYADFTEGVLASARTTEKVWMQIEFIW